MNQIFYQGSEYLCALLKIREFQAGPLGSEYLCALPKIREFFQLAFLDLSVLSIHSVKCYIQKTIYIYRERKRGYFIYVNKKAFQSCLFLA